MSAEIPNIKMVDLVAQYHHIKSEIDVAIQSVVDRGQFINGPAVKDFELSLAKYLDVKHVIGCANGTDALQVALMALNLDEGDEVILPAFTYPATVEVVALLKLKPILVDVQPGTFNLDINHLKSTITAKTKVIIPVHLFGQCADMESIISIADERGIKIIEDNAQALGSSFLFSDNVVKYSGTMGDLGTTSFFPTKNLGCFGDGGAIMTNDDDLASKVRMICNHGQQKKYHHSIIGVNSRLDSIQAAVLNTKLVQLDHYISKRQNTADIYDRAFEEIDGLAIPKRSYYSTHTFHQYTLRVADHKREALKKHLNSKGIPSMVYYPLPIHKQIAYTEIVEYSGTLEQSEKLCMEVISLPMHTELTSADQEYIIDTIKNFFGSGI